MQNHPTPRHARNGKVFVGILLLAVGSIWFLKNMGFTIPNFLFSKGIFLIIFGLFISFRSRFRHPLGIIFIVLGSLFVAEKALHVVILWNYVWPTLIIIFGLFMIFGRGFRRNRNDWYGPNSQPGNSVNPVTPTDHLYNPDLRTDNVTYAAEESVSIERSLSTDEDYLETTSVFGGTRKMILSKNFKGGEVVTIMGGAELNFSQADIQGRAVLDVTQIMGGTKIIVPSTWDIRSGEMVAILGGIDDKRIIQPGGIDPTKVLIIKGTSVLGGIDIRSY